tara:strand:+ start:441 stop:1394 length:954 start_codon:yes stop_codon:yes gene_type:complete
MKIFFLVFIVLPFLSFGNQTDTIFLKSKEYIVCDIIKLENNEIFYKLINDDYIRNIQNDEVSRVIYLLGESTIIKKNIEPKSNFFFDDNHTTSLRKEKLSFSPIIGLNFSKHYSKHYNEIGGQSNLIKLSYGASIKYDYHKSFASVLAILKAVKGTRFVSENIQYELFGGDSGMVRSINEDSYHYISIPLKLEYKKYLSDKFSLKLSPGVYYAYLLKADSYYKTTGDGVLLIFGSEEFTNTGSIDINSFINRNDYGLIFEFGFGYELKKLFNLNIDFGYEHGFSNINTRQAPEIYPKDYFYNYNRSYFVTLSLQYYL